MEAVIKAINVGASKLCQEGVGITILPYCVFLRLTELILGIIDLFLLILKDLPQHFRLLLQLTSNLL